METTHVLRQDHALLRKKLTLLASALYVAPEARFVIREMCFSLHRMLQDHLERERRLIPRSEFAQGVPNLDHFEADTMLRAVNELLLSGMRSSMPVIVARLSQVIDTLTVQMEEQESALFPTVDESCSQGATTLQAPISGTMSVNEILHRYPQTEQVFEQLHVNRLREGYDSVDELAWRHGMEVSHILEQLRQIATAFPSF